MPEKYSASNPASKPLPLYSLPLSQEGQKTPASQNEKIKGSILGLDFFYPRNDRNTL